MADKLIGSLIYDDHPEPKKARPLAERLKVPVSLLLVLMLVGGLLYRFVNYREEARVQRFLEEVAAGRYEDAYALWDGDERYSIDDFLVDWGEQGYYTSGMETYDVVDSNNRGTRVIVYATVNDGFPIAILVDKDTLLLSFSPENKYSGRPR
jgi:hypothetical protein